MDIELTKNKIIAKCCALVAVLIGQALRFEISVSWLDVSVRYVCLEVKYSDVTKIRLEIAMHREILNRNLGN